MQRPLTRLLLLLVLAGAVHPSAAALDVEVLRPVAGLPPHVVGLFEEPIGFQQPTGGSYYVFDRRGHAVYTVDADRSRALKLVEIGPEMGRIIQPRGFDVAPDGSFVIADAPRGQARIQVFGGGGLRQSGFFLPSTTVAGVSLDNFVLSGVAAIEYSGERLIVSHPETGALFTEYSLGGRPLRNIGRLRATGLESDRELHVALNAGLPLVDPTGGYFFVFLAGRPMFRKYDEQGALVFERHVEGRELDGYLANMPTRWPARRLGDREIPYVAPIVKSAAVSPQGDLWIALTLPVAYVYDREGDKSRTVQFNATGAFSPASMSFTRGGRLLVTPGAFEFDPAP